LKLGTYSACQYAPKSGDAPEDYMAQALASSKF
jgi:hypothetical protein